MFGIERLGTYPPGQFQRTPEIDRNGPYPALQTLFVAATLYTRGMPMEQFVLGHIRIHVRGRSLADLRCAPLPQYGYYCTTISTSSLHASAKSLVALDDDTERLPISFPSCHYILLPVDQPPNQSPIITQVPKLPGFLGSLGRFSHPPLRSGPNWPQAVVRPITVVLRD